MNYFVLSLLGIIAVLNVIGVRLGETRNYLPVKSTRYSEDGINADESSESGKRYSVDIIENGEKRWEGGWASHWRPKRPPPFYNPPPRIALGDSGSNETEEKENLSVESKRHSVDGIENGKRSWVRGWGLRWRSKRPPPFYNLPKRISLRDSESYGTEKKENLSVESRRLSVDKIEKRIIRWKEAWASEWNRRFPKSRRTHRDSESYGAEKKENLSVESKRYSVNGIENGKKRSWGGGGWASNWQRPKRPHNPDEERKDEEKRLPVFPQQSLESGGGIVASRRWKPTFLQPFHVLPRPKPSHPTIGYLEPEERIYG